MGNTNLSCFHTVSTSFRLIVSFTIVCMLHRQHIVNIFNPLSATARLQVPNRLRKIAPNFPEHSCFTRLPAAGLFVKKKMIGFNHPLKLFGMFKVYFNTLDISSQSWSLPRVYIYAHQIQYISSWIKIILSLKFNKQILIRIYKIPLIIKEVKDLVLFSLIKTYSTTLWGSRSSYKKLVSAKITGNFSWRILLRVIEPITHTSSTWILILCW